VSIAGAAHRVEQHLVLEKRAGFDLVIDERDVHANHPTRTDIQVAHFGVTHDAGRKADARAVRFEQRLRIFLAEFVVKRRGGNGDGVALAGGGVAPAVDDDQRERRALLSQTSPLRGMLFCRDTAKRRAGHLRCATTDCISRFDRFETTIPS
jgi:hypothetical protein